MATAAAATAAAPGLSPSDVHVLLVDDDRVPRMVVASQLKKFQYRGMLGEREAEGDREGAAALQFRFSFVARASRSSRTRGATRAAVRRGCLYFPAHPPTSPSTSHRV